jgi:hypothetical protein
LASESKKEIGFLIAGQGNTDMKAIKLPKELERLLDVAEASKEEILVFTDEKRPVAALVSLRKVDWESFALGTNSEFLRIIETARKQIRAGKKTSLEELEGKFKLAKPNKPMKRPPLGRRRLSPRRSPTE